MHARRLPRGPSTQPVTPEHAQVFSGIQPTGSLHLGNYLGAVSQWVRELPRLPFVAATH